MGKFRNVLKTNLKFIKFIKIRSDDIIVSTIARALCSSDNLK